MIARHRSAAAGAGLARPGRPSLLAAGVLAIVYAATVAPDVTFWDAGEFIAAAHALGIPHPPGTPLYILLLHVWGMAASPATYALATNLFSAAAMIAAAALSAGLVRQWMIARGQSDSGAMAIAAAICAGTMFTAWSSATETEVYALALTLSVLMVAAGHRAGVGHRRWAHLLAYCFGLAASLHASALVAAPAAILLAASDAENRFDWRQATRLGGVALIAMSLATASAKMAAGGFIMLVVAVPFRNAPARYLAGAASMTGMVLVGASPVLFMLVRAQLDPAVNQGNPDTWTALVDVIARRQYDVAGLWPRRAPFWLQVGNWFEYADWQSALSLGPSVIPTIPRVLVTLVFLALAVEGSRRHFDTDRRSWRAMLLLVGAGSLGVIVYLNLRAGPSFAWGILPDGVIREARERDYFFLLGFWGIGMWAGVGAVSVASRLGLPVLAGVVIAGLPIALNWTAINRRASPEAGLPAALARGILEHLPPRAVIFVSGDNDTYPLWYLQQVRGVRRDVLPVTIPLLGAGWYGEEIRRRNPDLRLPAGRVGTTAIVSAARSAGRPVLASPALRDSELGRLGECWRFVGLALALDAAGCGAVNGETRILVDTASVGRWIDRWAPPRVTARPSIDPVAGYFVHLLGCPRRILDETRDSAPSISLDSTCKRR